MRIHFFATLMACCALFSGVPAFAHHVSVDFGPIFGDGGDGDDFGTDTTGDGTACTAGSSGPESCPLTLTNNASTIAIPLGFPINFGSGAVSSLYINENGIVSFTAPITSTTFSALASVGQPVIAAYFADLTSVPFVGTVFEMAGTNFGQIMYQRGSASALPGSDGNFDQSDEVPAFSVLWYGPTNSSGVQIFTQLIIYSHSASASGDFDIRYRYGQADTDEYNAGTGATGIAGLLLGSNSLTIPNPLLGSTDYFYSVRGGKLVGAVAPPPPVTLACPTATAQVGVAYSSALVAGGGVVPYTFSSTGVLPGGLSLNTATGAVTGVPISAGKFTFTAQVADSTGTPAGTLTANCAIAVSAATQQLSVSPANISFGSVKRFDFQYKVVTLTNTGSAPVTLSKVSVTPAAGTDRGDFLALSLCGPALAVGKSCPVYVVLFASELGSLSATIDLPNSATPSPLTLPVSATVIPYRH